MSDPSPLDPSQSPPPPFAPAHLPQAPPTQPGAILAHDRPPTWSLVLGIVLSVLGVMGMGWYALQTLGAVMRAAMGDFAAAPSDPQQRAMFDAINRFAVFLAIGHGALLLSSLALAVAGIGLCVRKQWALTLCKWWAVAKIILAVTVGSVTAFQQYAMMDTIMQQGAAGPGGAPAPQFVLWMTIGGGACWAVWQLLLPVGLLITLTRPAFRRDTDKWFH